jgi:CelD/BcsL family acetyltransferase involved in cellulose biosynthesis
MASADQAVIHSRLSSDESRTRGASARSLGASDARTRIALSLYHDLATVEQEWRRFEQVADCTAFQSYDWLSTWRRHIGALEGALPAIVVGRGSAGETLFIVPLAIARSGLMRRLTFLGHELCDYNAPLLAPHFTEACGAEFDDIWRRILALLRAEPRCAFDIVVLDKMPEQVGGQRNPFTQLAVSLNPSGAYRASLLEDWDSFYAAKRSSQTRRRDRSKRRRLAEFGAVNLVSADAPDAAERILDVLIDQKRRSFARMGIVDLFSRPGLEDFFRDLVAQPSDRRLAHVSVLDVGGSPAAVNLGLEFRGVYYHVLASYDDGEMSRFGPGAIHLQELIRRAAERGCSTFDFTIGDEPYKRDWCDGTIRLYDHVSAATLRGIAAAAMVNLARRAKRTIKQSRLWPALLALRSRLAGRAQPRDVGERAD